jgi:hypothetical protein
LVFKTGVWAAGPPDRRVVKGFGEYASMTRTAEEHRLDVLSYRRDLYKLLEHAELAPGRLAPLSESTAAGLLLLAN